MGLNERKTGIAAAFCTSLTKNLTNPTASEAVLQAYGINPSTPDDEAFKAIIEYATDIVYYAPALAFAQSWPGKAYYYHFNEPNPFDGQFRGQATHMLDAAYLFQNYNEKLSPESREVAISLATDFIKFANGSAPWKEYSKEKGAAKSFDSNCPTGLGLVESNGWNNGRRETLFKLKETGQVDIDELSVSWDKFLAGQ
jgi:carboxylesterase type B